MSAQARLGELLTDMGKCPGHSSKVNSLNDQNVLNKKIFSNLHYTHYTHTLHTVAVFAA